MMRLVDDLLDVSRITRGKIDLKKKHVDIGDVMSKAIETASPLIEQRNHYLDVSAPLKPVTVDGDEARLAQVFTNLLTNAAKYTDPGGHIWVSVKANNGSVIVEVRDSGQGIEPDLLPHVFDLFVQGMQTAERAVGGLGLGLTLVRSLVTLHGGTVEAHSEGRGKGSTFRVSLPRLLKMPAAPVKDPLAITPVTNGARQRILIVDDNVDARDLLSEILVALGHEVKTAPDGIAALELIESFRPDVSILDIGLPVMDGFELATRIRERMKQATPSLIALSGYAQESDQKRSQEVGFERHLVKPVDVKLLVDSISELQAARARV
jgi:CheY-like chemotaxis protein